jgi:hypothetical protein
MSKPNPLQEGGFMMSDETIPKGETLYAIMKKHFDKPDNKAFFDSVLQQTDSVPNLSIAFLDTPGYKEIYTKLINIIMTDEVYTQTFVYNDGTKYEHNDMHNYHIQLCALMTMSFLIELEVFSVVHNYIPINIAGKAQKNILPSVFVDHPASTTPERRYSSQISGGVDAILKYFTDTLDKFFNDFMTQLVVQIQLTVGVLSRQEILEAIVPVNSKDPPHRTNTFDFIYVNWKDLIARKIQDKMISAAYIAGFYPRRINQAIKNAMDHVEHGGSKYIAEGTGFFSFLYLLPVPSVHASQYNGSCITYSMLELYIMARLHVNANNLTLNMEIQPDDPPALPNTFRPHRTWLTIQNDPDINLSAVSHWATRYRFASHELRLRSFFDGLIKTQYLFNFVDPNKPKLCLLLLYPIFDSYIHYLNQLDVIRLGKAKTYETEINTILLPFIRERIKFVKLLFTKKTISKEVDEKTRIGMKSSPPPPTPKKFDTLIPAKWFVNVFGFAEPASLTDIKTSFQVKKSPTNHILMTVRGKPKEIDVGVFRYMSVKQLLDVASANTNAKSVFGFDPTDNLKYYTVTSTASAVHTNPSYYGSIFQVASQFNALEMAGPTLTPENGITIYIHDKTQGPVCAMVCPFGTLYRNYFCMPADGKQPEDKSVNGNPQIGTADGKGSGNNQINTLTDLKNVDKCFDGLTFQNGYIFVNNKTQLDAINKYLSTPENFWKAMMAIKYVIQEDTPVVNVTGDGTILSHTVSQIYCSAYPVAYSTDPPTKGGESWVPNTKKKDYALLSSMLLHAVYYSTLAYAVSRITEDDIRKNVFLTKVGGDAFGNNMYLIHTAIHNAVRHFIAYPIDVYIVNYEPPGVIADPIETTIDKPKVKATSDDSKFESAPYTNIQNMLDEKAKAETEKVQIETEKKVAAEKEEDTKLRLILKKSTGKKEDLDKAKLEEKAERAKAKAKKKEEDRIHEEKTEKKHINLKDATDKAIKTFSEKLTAGDGDDKKYAKILNDLMTEINKDREVRAKADAEADAKSKTGKTTKLVSKNMDKVGDIIELNVDIGSDVHDVEKRVIKKFNRIETGGGGDCLFHTLRYLLTTAGKFEPTSDKTADMMKIRNAIVDHVDKLSTDGFKHLKQVIGDRLDFKKSNEGPDRAPLHLDNETAKQGINVDGGVRTDGNMVLFSDRVVNVNDVSAKEGKGTVMKYVSQDTAKNYFTVMREKGTFGTDFELGIAAALYDIMLCVISHEGRCQYYIFDKPKNEVRGIEEAGEYDKIKKNIWYIYNYTNTHYQYLKCIDAAAECPIP